MKLLNKCITMLAVVGVVICILAVNKMDYNIARCTAYPVIDTFKMMLIGFSFCIPSVVRRICNG